MGKKQFLRGAIGLWSFQTRLLVSRLASYWQKYIYLAKSLSTLVTRSRLQNASQMLRLVTPFLPSPNSRQHSRLTGNFFVPLSPCPVSVLNFLI